MREAERALRAAEKDHAARVRRCRKALARAEKDHQRAVKAAQKEVRGAEKPDGDAVEQAERALGYAREIRLLARYSSVSLWEDRIETPEGEAPLAEGASAVVDTGHTLALTKRAALARLASTSRAANAIVDGKAADRLFLLVETPRLVSVVPCEDGAGEEFAAQVNLAALNAGNYSRQRDEAVAHAEWELRSLEHGRSSRVAEAQARLAAAEADTQAVEEARAALAEAEADTAEVERRRRELDELTG